MEKQSNPTASAAPQTPAGVSPFRTDAPKPLYAVGRRDAVFAAVLAVLTVFGVCAGLWGGFQAGYAAAFFLLFLTYSLYLGGKGKHPGAFAAVCGGLSAALCAVFVCTSGALVRAAAVCVMAPLSMVWFAALAGKRAPADELGLASHVLRLTADSLGKAPQSVRALGSSQSPAARKASKSLLGVLCALPVLCVVAALLIRSDAAFGGLMQHLFSDPGSAAAQGFLSVCAFPLLLAFGFSVKKEPQSVPVPKDGKHLDTGFLAAFVGLLDVCYAAYLFAQLAYFFSAFSGILPEGYTFTYAEYARRGFFELCGVAAVDLAVLYLMLLLSRKTEGKLPVILRVLGTFTTLFTLLLICTAAAKLALYIRQFGMTVQRLGAGAAMLCMAVTFVALLLRFYLPRVRVLPVAAVTAAVLTLVLGAGNVYGFCAKYNYNAYRSGALDTVDTAYLRRLGDEGVPYLLELTQDEDADVRRKAAGNLCIAVEKLYEGEYREVPLPQSGTADDEMPEAAMYFAPLDKNHPNLSQQSVPRRRAYALLDAFLREHPDFLRDNVSAQEEAWGEEADTEYWF